MSDSDSHPVMLDITSISAPESNAAMEFLCKSVEDRLLWDSHPTDRVLGAMEDASTSWVNDALKRIHQEAVTAWIASTRGRPDILAKAKGEDRNQGRLNFRCQEIEVRMRTADPGTLDLSTYLEVIDCWLFKYLPPAMAEQTAKRRTVQQYLAGFLREDILKRKVKEPKSPQEAKELVQRLPETVSGARVRWQVSSGDEARIRVAQASAARLVQDITQQTRSRMAKVLIHAEQQRIGEDRNQFAPRPLEQALRDEFGDLNRDWRRTAVTETAIHASDGYLSRKRPGEKVQWMAHPGPCRYCKEQHGKVFTVVLPDAPKKDPDTQVWVGKHVMNVGRSMAKRKRLADGTLTDRTESELIKPAIPAHPTCYCTWLPVVEA